MTIEPFRVSIAAREIEDLKHRLARTRWPDTLEGSGWSLGADLDWMRGLVEHWSTGYDWRAAEAKINSHPQFRARVNGLWIHFIHQRGNGPAPMPLIITHGWPGSFLEMLPIVPLLADPGRHGGDPADAFDVVVPSLPGYGFSERPAQPGCNTFFIAGLWASLMEGLGYSRFGAQGGDWGASVTTLLGLLHPDRTAGIHLNYIPGSFKPWTGPGSRPLTGTEEKFVKEAERWYEVEGGYAHQQKTAPQTLAFGLNDSPVGLAAWILEKFRGWSDCGGNLESRFDRDDLLTNVSLYWFTQTIHSSCRLYHESARRPLHFGKDEKVAAPCGVARFPLEAPMPPREWVERVYDVRRWTEMPRGGHFAAMEEPEALARDMREFFRPLRHATKQSA